MRAHHKRHNQDGPGGIKCPCCCPLHRGRSLKATKQFMNRKYRRKSKIEINKEVE